MTATTETRGVRPFEQQIIMSGFPMERVEYVRKDTFDANIQRIEALLERNLIEQRAMSAELRSEMKAMNDRLEAKIDGVRTELRGDIKALDVKIYALEGKLSQNLVMTGVITTIFGIIITLVVAAFQFWK